MSGFLFCMFLGLVAHDVQDLAVGLAHPLARERADVADRLLDAVRHKAVAGAEFLPVFVHVVAEDAGVHGGGHFPPPYR